MHLSEEEQAVLPPYSRVASSKEDPMAVLSALR
ncbi:hypothetical protein EGR_10386 [Echinococcus granulosus]|uniref:Uncharacterized protein n=1 Tax=Echinococcus granulosus TaxID=6210 RepID=W6U2G6_ECHGR|nr:hypothetical protein EGR_10386 [Echinococcus granulosus]EUB54746.1 hypothetical protein EGR_10386 [Echinococcus granulosus]